MPKYIKATPTFKPHRYCHYFPQHRLDKRRHIKPLKGFRVLSTMSENKVTSLWKRQYTLLFYSQQYRHGVLEHVML